MHEQSPTTVGHWKLMALHCASVCLRFAGLQLLIISKVAVVECGVRWLFPRLPQQHQASRGLYAQPLGYTAAYVYRGTKQGLLLRKACALGCNIHNRAAAACYNSTHEASSVLYCC
jgi:hypothetical protein